MQKFVWAAAAVLAATVGTSAAIDSSEAARLTAAARVVQDIQATIPLDYWNRSRCVIVIPDLKKAAFIIGGEYGKGLMSCRSGERWSAPVFMQIAKGSWGFQVGAEQVDVVMLVMNEQGVQKLLDNKVNLGVDASIAAGPIGRQAQAGTDAALKAEILSYSRASGLFAGIDLSGGVLRPDDDGNQHAYGLSATARTILGSTGISAPTQATALLNALSAVHGGASDRPTATSGVSPKASAVPAQPATNVPSTTDSDIRTRAIDIQQTVGRMLDSPPTAVGTSGSSGATVVVDRAQLLRLRQQIDALLASMNQR